MFIYESVQAGTGKAITEQDMKQSKNVLKCTCQPGLTLPMPMLLSSKEQGWKYSINHLNPLCWYSLDSSH